MTPEQWQRVELELSHAYARAHLVIDGFDVLLSVEPVKPLKCEIAVYVNGVIKGSILAQDCDERRRFMRPVRYCAMSAKDYADWRRAFGKRDADKRRKAATGYYYMPMWPSFGALKRHLVKNNQSIALKVSS